MQRLGYRIRYTGEIPVAYVALKEDGSADEREICRFCMWHLGRYAIPRKVIFIKALPKNAAGKIVKRELRKAGEIERRIDLRKQTANER